MEIGNTFRSYKWGGGLLIIIMITIRTETALERGCLFHPPSHYPDDAIEAMTTVEFIDGDERSAELTVLVG